MHSSPRRGRGALRGVEGTRGARRADPGRRLLRFPDNRRGASREEPSVAYDVAAGIRAALRLTQAIQRDRGEAGNLPPRQPRCGRLVEPGDQETLREQGLVDEFRYYYAASMPVGDGSARSTASTVTSWIPRRSRGLQRPAGYAARLSCGRGLHPARRALRVISGGLDLSELNKVYPLAAI